MRTTVTFDEELLERAKEITGEERVSNLANEGLRALIRTETSKRLIALGGSMAGEDIEAPPRRRFEY